MIQRETVPDEVVRPQTRWSWSTSPRRRSAPRLAHGRHLPAGADRRRAGQLLPRRQPRRTPGAGPACGSPTGSTRPRRVQARHGIGGTWETRERVLVALTGSAEGDRLIRRAARMAQRTNGDLVAVHVDTAGRARRRRTGRWTGQRRLVERAGRHVPRDGRAPTSASARGGARGENATQLVIGATHRGRLGGAALRLE